MAAYDIYADPGYYSSCAKCKSLAKCNDYKAKSTRAALETKRDSDEAIAKLARN